MDPKLIGSMLLTVVFVMLIFGVPIWLVLKGKAVFDNAVRRDLERIYSSSNQIAAAMGSVPKVTFTYHTYSGVLLWVTQQQHRISAPPQIAEETLSALLRHTLKYGFLAYGALIIPLLAYGNYLAQRRSIRRQALDVRNLRMRP
jgi:hypothetical protein